MPHEEALEQVESGTAPGDWKRCEPSAHDGRRHARPPENRGRRGQRLIPEIPGLAQWLEEQYREVPRPAFREIEQRLRASEFWPLIEAAGRRTGKDAIRHDWLRWNADLARKRIVAEYAATLNADENGEDVLSLEATITRLANISLLEAFEEEMSEGGGMTPKKAALIELHRKLQASSARREQERRAGGAAYRRAIAQAREEIVEILKQNPEASRLVLAAIDKAQKSTEEQ